MPDRVGTRTRCTVFPRIGWMVAASCLLSAACAGPSVLVGGETVRAVGPPEPVLAVRVVAADDLTPLAGAEVRFDGEAREAGPGGMSEVVWYERAVTVRAEAPGFEPKRVEVVALPEEGPVQVALNPIVITGAVTTPEGEPVQGAEVALGPASALTDATGRFELTRATEGVIAVRRAAWRPVAREWGGEKLEQNFQLEPLLIRGIRVNAENAGNPVVWEDFLDMAAASDVNAFILDTKDESGEVKYATEVQTAHEIGAVRVRYDVEQALADMAANDIYAITRIVTFQDTFMAQAHPEWAAGNIATGQPWQSDRGQKWMDPTDRSSWEYPLALALEACRLGFDEIQFDYVRFPSDGPIELLVFDGVYDEENRVRTIAAFLTEARRRINPLGCAVAADIFAITVSSPDDQGIGQRPEDLSAAVDVLSPMIYPTHYADGWLGFDEPNDHPAAVIGGALDDGLPRMRGSAILRPWLQTSTYGTAEVQTEIAEARARELGWMLWSSLNTFDTRSLPRDPTVAQAPPVETTEAVTEGASDTG